MKKIKLISYLLRLLFAFASITLTACGSSHSQPEGQFAGKLYSSDHGLVTAAPVSFAIAYDTKTTGTIVIRDAQQNTVKILKLDLTKPEEVKLEGQILAREESNKDTHSTLCFSSASAHLCFDQTNVSLELKDSINPFSLSGDASSTDRNLDGGLERPRSYTLDEVLQLSMVRNFDSQIEYEHSLQARLAAKSAYLQLLPHVGTSTVLSVASGGIFGMLGAIGDLVPFLFPSRWFHAKEAREMSAVERDTLALLRADLMPQVEGLTYLSLQDENSLNTLNAILKDAQSIYKTVADLEARSQMPQGSGDHLLSTTQGFQLQAQTLALQIRKDHSAIAQSLGMINPNAVISVSIPNELNPIENATLLVADDLLASVLDRSLELQQIYDLTRLARTQKHELPFDWLDPAADPAHQLGFGLRAQIQICNSKLEELFVLGEKAQQSLQINLQNAVDDYNLAFAQYPEVKDHFEIQKKRWETVISQVGAGSSLNTLDIQSVLNDFVNAGLNSELTHATFRVARARIDRLLMQNQYANSSQF